MSNSLLLTDNEKSDERFCSLEGLLNSTAGAKQHFLPGQIILQTPIDRHMHKLLLKLFHDHDGVQQNGQKSNFAKHYVTMKLSFVIWNIKCDQAIIYYIFVQRFVIISI